MKKTILALGLLALLALSICLFPQLTPWLNWTFLPEPQMNEVIGETSGEEAYNVIVELGGFSRDRPTEEYRESFLETRTILGHLKRHGLAGASEVRFPGSETWDGEAGELWEVSPLRQKLASYRDMTVMLAGGSTSADVTAELVWVGRGTKEELAGKDLAQKIAVTEGWVGEVHERACLEMNAAGVVAISQSRIAFDPLQVLWGRVSGSRDGKVKARFAFLLPFREGILLKERLLAGEKIVVRAQVKSQTVSAELQDVTCHIPGGDPGGQEVILTAHLFEGYVKQGANDNISGCAAILEVARTLHTLIEEGRLPRPKRTIRFLWTPEYSGTIPWVKANRSIVKRTLCNINLDMVGEHLSRNQGIAGVDRTPYSRPHYLNDVMENYLRYVGETSREKIHNRPRPPYRTGRRIVAPSGADEPFFYTVEAPSGGSDHEVFNDWSAGVPGVYFGVWPDQWYHTSGDHADKADPTQMKRMSVIAAAAAYTIASADDRMATSIASEVASNGVRRLGHQLVRGLEQLNQADAKTLEAAYGLATVFLATAIENEKGTLQSVLELAVDRARVGGHIRSLTRSVEGVGRSLQEALLAHMRERARQLGASPVSLRPSDLEKRASRAFPRPTAKVQEGGFTWGREWMEKLPEEVKKKYPVDFKLIASTGELQSLVNGRRSVLDIVHNLDAQYEKRSDLQQVWNYLELLRFSGLVEW